MKYKNYFSDCSTVEEVKKKYKQLAKAYHPDLGGDTVIMQEINNSYQENLEALDGSQHTEEGRTYTYKYNPAAEKELMEKLAALLSLKLEGVEIWIIGRWLWVRGDTRPHKEELKAQKLTWAKHREAWVWKPSDEPKPRKSSYSLDSLADRYGAEVHKPQPKEKEATAKGHQLR